MNKKTGLAISGVLALVAALLLFKYAADLKAELGFDSLVTVVVAKVPMPRGAIINRAQIQFRRVPKTYVHPNAVRTADLETVLGRKLGNRLAPRQQLLWIDLTGGKAGADRLSDLVAQHLRALTIPVDPRFALAGMLQPSDRVDILLTYTNWKQDRVTKTVLQNIQVAAVGSEMGLEAETDEARRKAEKHPPNNVTVLVAPADAELIVYAVDRGKIALTLRSRGDREEVVLVDRDFREEIGENVPSNAPKPVRRKRDPVPDVIDILKGQYR